MAVLSREQIVGLAAQVGLGRGQIPVAGAICDAESGRKTDAVGRNPGGSHQKPSRDRGLWQINDVAHPDVSDACAFDPLCNARAMFAISSGGTNWYPWTTYTNGAYKQFLNAYLGITGGPIYTPPSSFDTVSFLVQRIRQGYPPWKAVLQTYEQLVNHVQAAAFGAQNANTDLGSPRF